MKKINFNDRYVLTDAVIGGIKNNTRRIEGGGQFQLAATEAEDFFYEEDAGYIVMCCQGVEIFRHKCRYKLGEVVAVAQSYNEATREFPHMATTLVGHDILGSEPGCTNKMFVRADLMPHQIRITGIRCERLRDISDEDCIKEGVRVGSQALEYPYYFIDAKQFLICDYKSPREAFAALIDKVSGRGTWESNPWVVVYEFELVK